MYKYVKTGKQARKIMVEVFYMRKYETITDGKTMGDYTVNKLKSSQNPYELEEFANVATFTVTTDATVETICNTTFDVMNSDDHFLTTETGQSVLRQLGVTHTSMSVGDFLVFDGSTIAVCKGIGWEIISPIDDVCDTPEMKASIDEQMDRYAEQESQA